MPETSDLQEAVYQIKVDGPLDEKWSNWFNGMTLSFEQANGDSPITILTVRVVDQARLRGILNKLWDMNLAVISLNRLEKPGV